ncbi:alpha/beta hydrolase [Nakamurella leprariae]|uniref:alpha/beta hydrolase n=1 Tax=Nakamurella leprariae TaxID=2803911 RepID=UPI002E28F161|nr:alpha/beta-hydrolase family protein [Nakamurella leprariae]
MTTSWGWRPCTLPGAWTALVIGCLSFTPSLLPRPALFQGVAFGLTAALGYALGVTGAWVWRALAERPARRPTPRSWRRLVIGGGLLLVVSYGLGLWWQSTVRGLFGLPGEAVLGHLLFPVGAVLVFVGLLAAARGVRWVFRRLARALTGRIGGTAARAVGALVAAAMTVLLLSGVLWNGMLRLADRSFAALDATTGATASRPTTPERSGGPGSRVPWDSLGMQGRNFVGRGPTADEIAAFTGASAPTPVRAYAGVDSAADVEDRARLAVEDLERAGGFDRGYLLVAGTTGTGWVDPGALTAFEYETGGDSAAVAIQYSHLPSALSLMADQDRARIAGRALFDAVSERWLARPADDRPRLFVFGESLGSFSLEAAFSGERDLHNRTAGGLFAGPPNFNVLYREFTDHRDAGSPEISPVFRDGRTVRFSDLPSAPAAPADRPWPDSRVLYLLHPSDPITWWSPELLWRRPDWLAEPRGRDVSDAMVWIPLVTFWQVTLDLAEFVETPDGHGHTFTREYVDGWAQVLQPPGWTAARAEQLRKLLSD